MSSGIGPSMPTSITIPLSKYSRTIWMALKSIFRTERRLTQIHFVLAFIVQHFEQSHDARMVQFLLHRDLLPDPLFLVDCTLGGAGPSAEPSPF